jgi:hypothetical protein
MLRKMHGKMHGKMFHKMLRKLITIKTFRRETQEQSAF